MRHSSRSYLQFICTFLILLIVPFTQADLPGLRFLLYTKSNKYLATELKSSDVDGINKSTFVANKPTKFLCHGYSSNYLAAFPQNAKNNYLSLATDYNVIAVDWASLSALTVPFPTAAENAQKVGREIAILMQVLITNGKSQLSDFHFAGHSLGGQVGAFISSNLPNGQKIPRVTGLDPARPGFDPATVPTNGRLDPSDADFVDVIRTSTGVNSGTDQPDPPGTGNVDFYPNGGVTQPGCSYDTSNLCSHNRAFIFFAESIINNNFKAYKCTSYVDFQGSCPKSNPAYMGEYVSRSISGTYYLNTGKSSPYALG